MSKEGSSSPASRRIDGPKPLESPFAGLTQRERAVSAPSDSGARDGQRLARMLSATSESTPNATSGPAAPPTSLFSLPALGSVAAPAAVPGSPLSPTHANGSLLPSLPLAGDLGSGLLPNMSSPSLPQPTVSAFDSMQPGLSQLLGPDMDSLAALQLEQARQAGMGSQEPPSLAGLLTPADASLLSAMMQLQQRQAAAQLAPGDARSPRGMRSGHGRTNQATSSLYKTELCRSWQESGSCRYGNKCQFAHGPDQLRPIQRHPKYKTENCRTFALMGSCPYGARCRFIHSQPQPVLQPQPAGLSPALLPPLEWPLMQQPTHADGLNGHFAAFGLGGAGSGFGSLPLNGGSYLDIPAEQLQVPSPGTPRNGAQSLFPLLGLPGSEPCSPYLPAPSFYGYSPLARSGGSGASGLSSIDSTDGSEQRRLPVFKAFTDSPPALP